MSLFVFMALLLLTAPGLSMAQFNGGDGSPGNPYQITTWNHLNNVRDYLDDHFILMNNLDQNSTGYNSHASSAANEGKGWDPIGDYKDEVAFTGNFDGNGYTISDLVINRHDEEDVGLFGYTYSEDLGEIDPPDIESGGKVENLILKDVDIFGGAFVGALVATNEGILNDISISGKVKGFSGVGGVAGDNYGLIVNATSTADAIFPLEELLELFEEEETAIDLDIDFPGGFGGVAGYNTGAIALSNANGFVGIPQNELASAIENEEFFENEFIFLLGMGGLVGINEGAVVVSYATGEVLGVFGVGGLIGVNGFEFFAKNKSGGRAISYKTTFSAVDLDDVSEYFTDLGPFNIHNTYATGEVKGGILTGGLIGFVSDGIISNSYSSGPVIFLDEELGKEIPEETDPEALGFGGLIGDIDDFALKSVSKSTDAFRWSSLANFTAKIKASKIDHSNVINSFWDIQTSGMSTSGGGTGKTTAEMKDVDTFTDTSTEGLDESWDFDDLWAIRSGDYISYPYFGNDNNAPLQTPAPGLSPADGYMRLMAGAGKETEVDANLFMYDGDDEITIVSVPLRGELLLENEEVENNNVISKSDIEAGKLVYIPDDETDKTIFGYDYAELLYETTEMQHTLTIDLAARAINYNLPEGWILFSSPTLGQTVGNLLINIHTEGFPGSNNHSASTPTVYLLDHDNFEWDAVNSANLILMQGEGLLTHIFDEDTPKNPMLRSNGPWAPLDGTFSYDDILGYDPDQGEFGNSHFLLGNPHPIGIDICRMLTEGKNIANSFDLWRPEENDGNGGYVNYSCDIAKNISHPSFGESVEPEFMYPFAGFWVRTTDENPVLSITEDDYIPYDFEILKSVESKPEPLSLELNHEEKNYDETVHILFADKAELGLDRIDAIKLSSAGLAERYLSFFAMDEKNRSYSLRSLPAFTDEIVIPLGIETTEAGNYTLSWSLPSEQTGISYTLRDAKTGERVELNSGLSYKFSLSEDEVAAVSEKETANAKMGSPTLKAENIHPRFELVIGTSEGGVRNELPNNITLDQNYPNPFNPTTVIRYQLPQAAEVSLQVFDMAGRRVAELVNEQVSAGTHTISFDASRISSGVYMYRLKAGSTLLTRKLTVIK